MKRVNLEENEFLKNYGIAQYDRPYSATDIDMYSIMSYEEDNYQKLP